jgi:hypothetical protein
MLNILLTCIAHASLSDPRENCITDNPWSLYLNVRYRVE